MAVQFNHTIVHSRDRDTSAHCLAEILGLSVGEPFAMFLPVVTANDVNRNDGGRGVSFLDPSGHGMKAFTRPYGSDPSSPLNGVTEAVPGAKNAS